MLEREGRILRQFYYSFLSPILSSKLFKAVFAFTLSCHNSSSLDPILIGSSLPTEEELFGNKQSGTMARKRNNQLKQVFFSDDFTFLMNRRCAMEIIIGTHQPEVLTKYCTITVKQIGACFRERAVRFGPKSKFLSSAERSADMQACFWCQPATENRIP